MTFQPSAPFTVPLSVMTTTESKVNGVWVKSRTEGRTLLASFRTFGGTESEKDGRIAVEDTAVVETWFAPDLTAGIALRMGDGSDWEVLGTPEDVGMRHQYSRMKVRRIRGGA
jgi:hypothetical protein